MVASPTKLAQNRVRRGAILCSNGVGDVCLLPPRSLSRADGDGGGGVHKMALARGGGDALQSVAAFFLPPFSCVIAILRMLRRLQTCGRTHFATKLSACIMLI